MTCHSSMKLVLLSIEIWHSTPRLTFIAWQTCRTRWIWNTVSALAVQPIHSLFFEFAKFVALDGTQLLATMPWWCNRCKTWLLSCRKEISKNIVLDGAVDSNNCVSKCVFRVCKYCVFGIATKAIPFLFNYIDTCFCLPQYARGVMCCHSGRRHSPPLSRLTAVLPFP